MGGAAQGSKAKVVVDPYKQVPLSKKLGLKPDSVVAVVGAPDHFAGLLSPLPERTRLRYANRGSRDLTIWFVSTSGALHAGMAKMLGPLGPGGIWICWPKRSSDKASDLSHDVVQRAGLAAGLVDHKICAIDDGWSALRFARRA